MEPFSIAMLVMGIVSAIAGIGSTIATNRSNKKIQESVNETNARNVAVTNQANAQQAELAYSRNSVSGQLQQMMSNGISRQGALNAITGAGSYQPAQFTAAQAEASRNMPFNIDSAVNGMQGAFSSAQQMEQFRKQQENVQRQLDIAERDEQRRQEVHQQQLADMKLKHDHDQREYDATSNANAMWSILSSYVGTAELGSVHDITSFVEKNSNLRSLDEWKAIRNDTQALAKLQALLSSTQSTQQGSAQTRLVMNDANRIAFRNSMEELDKVQKQLSNAKLREELEQFRELRPIVQATANGNLQKLMQDIQQSAENHALGLTAQDIANKAAQYGLDVQQIRDWHLWTANAGRTGQAGMIGKVTQGLLDDISHI